MFKQTVAYFKMSVPTREGIDCHPFAPTCERSRNILSSAMPKRSLLVLLSMFTSNGELSLMNLSITATRLPKPFSASVVALMDRDSPKAAAATKNWRDCWLLTHAQSVQPHGHTRQRSEGGWGSLIAVSTFQNIAHLTARTGCWSKAAFFFRMDGWCF